MFEKENLLQLEDEVLRAVCQSCCQTYLNEEDFLGSGKEQEKALQDAEVVGSIIDVKNLLQELKQFLLCYEITVVSEETTVIISSCVGKRSECITEVMVFCYDADKPWLVTITLMRQTTIQCNHLELVSNLAERFVMQFAVLLADVSRTKEFYERYMEWMKPYQQKVQRYRTIFHRLVVRIVRNLVSMYPNQETVIMPANVNLLYLLRRLKHIFQAYEIEENRQNTVLLVEPQIIIRSKVKEELRFQLDIDTYNGILININVRNIENVLYRVLTPGQFIMLLRQISNRFQFLENPYCRLLSIALKELLLPFQPIKE